MQGRTKAGAYTNQQGGYELKLERASEVGEAAYVLQFKLQGYELQERPLPQPQLRPDAPLELRLDVQLRAVENGGLVTGVVESKRGAPVAGATVTLSRQQSPSNHAVSDADGNFSLPNVEIGPGYWLSVLAPVSFRDYSDQGIRVPEDGLSLKIVLETLATGRLMGRMVDVQGNPLPRLRIWLEGASARSAVPISGDERGFFELEEAPAGSLSFNTRTSPRLHVSGLTLRAGGEADVLLVLDWGEQEMAGVVLDDRGDPVAGAQVSLSWSQASGGLQSTSQRATGTDPTGSFRFSQLGPDEHRLEVRAPGYRTVQERHAVGRNAAEVEVRLEPDGS
jgi:5-hydroxyisourate hydrolase-like protein (transthyretin family)